jgi:Rrf2 family protein
MISQTIHYALKALISLAREPSRVSNAALIASEDNIPRKYLGVVMTELKRAGLVRAHVGKIGGYKLARSADTISIADIFHAINGPPSLFLGDYGTDLDGDADSPGFNDAVQLISAAQSEFYRILGEKKLSELVTAEPPRPGAHYHRAR